MRRYTVDELYEREEPCFDYTREDIEEIAGDGLTAREIAALDIPVTDRVWVITTLLDDHRLLCRQIALDTLYVWDHVPTVIREYLVSGDESMRQAVRDLSITKSDCATPNAVNAVKHAASRYPRAFSAIVHATSAVWNYTRHSYCSADERIAAETAQWEKYLQWAVEALEAEDIA